MINYIMLGKPGSGKGTQAEILSKNLSIPLISTGSLFYQYSQLDSDIGQAIKHVMDSGDLIDDALIMWVIKETLEQTEFKNGVIFDGVPRRLDQAKQLHDLLTELGHPYYIAFYINVNDDDVVQRISGRRICERNKEHVYHLIYNPPTHEGICGVCGGKLIQRSDDSAEQVKHRIDVYMEETSPLIDYYKRKGLLYEVDGTKSIEDVHYTIVNIVRLIRKHYM